MPPPYGLGRLAAPDPRDHHFLMRSLPAPAKLATRRLYRRGPVLDQGQTSTCVGHAWRAWLSGAPLMTRSGPDAFTIYDRCLPLDEFPSNDHDTDRSQGTSVRAGAKVLTEDSRVESYAWAFDVDDVRRWVLGGRGGVVLGIGWRNDMFNPDERGVIRATGDMAGGHAIFAYGLDDREGFIYLQNSWGLSYGGWPHPVTGVRTGSGCVRLPLEDLDRLLKEDGECCSALEQIPPQFRRSSTPDA